MKKIIYLFSIIAFALVTFSCEDDYTRDPEGAIIPTAPVFAAPGKSNIQITTLDNEVVDGFLLRLNWSKARFTYKNGLPAEVSDLKYTIEVDKAGEFPNPVEVITTNLLYTDLYAVQLNSLILNLYKEESESESADLMFRVKITTNQGEPAYSNLVSLNVIYVSIDEPEPEQANDIQIKWKQTEGSWDAFAIYAWGAAEVYGGWPGKVITPNTNGWYSVYVPNNRPIHLILNNNSQGAQFDFLNDPTESASYEINTTTGTWTQVENPAEEITIRWKYVGSDWTAFAIYAWGASPAGETFGGWPGAVVTPNAEGWCSVTVPAGQTVGNAIFNNANNGGQFDVKLNIISSVCFEITNDSYTVVDCQ